MISLQSLKEAALEFKRENADPHRQQEALVSAIRLAEAVLDYFPTQDPLSIPLRKQKGRE